MYTFHGHSMHFFSHEDHEDKEDYEDLDWIIFALWVSDFDSQPI